MKIAAIIILLTALGSPSWAESSDPLVGSWSMWNPRNVINTGPTDTEIIISGSPDSYTVSYTSGGINIVNKSSTPQIYKSVSTTYWRIPLTKTGDIYSFAVPEIDTVIQFRFVNDSLELVSDNDNSTQKRFVRKNSN